MLHRRTDCRYGKIRCNRSNLNKQRVKCMKQLHPLSVYASATSQPSMAYNNNYRTDSDSTYADTSCPQSCCVHSPHLCRDTMSRPAAIYYITLDIPYCSNPVSLHVQRVPMQSHYSRDRNLPPHCSSTIWQSCYTHRFDSAHSKLIDIHRH